MLTPKKEEFRLPVLKTRKGDLSKRWNVEYYVWQRSLNGGEGGLIRKLIHCPVKYKTAAERKRWGKEVVAQVTRMIADGYYVIDEPGYNHKPESKETPELPRSKPDILVSTDLTALAAMDQVVKVRESIKAYRKRTGESYRNAYRRFEDYLKFAGLTTLLVTELSSRHIYEFSDYIVLERGLSSRYRNNLVHELTTIFEDLISREYITKNPTEKVPDLPVQTSRKNLAFEPAQREKLEDHLRKNDPALYLFTRFIYQAFLRPIELTRLQVRDIDVVNNRIACHSSVAKGGSKKQITEYIEMTGALRKLIGEMHIDRFSGTHFLFGYGLETGRLPIERNRISERHQVALIGAELYNGELSMYSWKHTGVVNAWKAGASIEWLQRQLRHADLKDTVVYLKSLGLMLSEKTQVPEW